MSGSVWQCVAVCGSLWQSVAVFGSLWQSVPSQESFEILEIFKFEDIMTMVIRIVGGAIPPSVMVLFHNYGMIC